MDIVKVDQAFTEYIRPQTFPVAVHLCQSESELPAKVKVPARDMGVNISLCHAMALARRYGWTVAIDKTSSCYVAGLSLGFLPLLPDVADGSYQASIGLWGMTKEQQAESIQSMPKFEYGKYKYALVSPLNKAVLEPDVIVFYGFPAQVWVLLSAYLLATGKTGLPAKLAMGAGCTSYITNTMLTDEPQFVLIGTGERLGPHPQDTECAFSIPKSKIEKVVQGLEVGRMTGVFRYPVPTFMRYGSQHPQGYDKMLAHLLETDKA